MSSKIHQKISDEEVRETILQMFRRRNRQFRKAGRYCHRNLSRRGQSVLKRVRLFAKQLALTNEIEILRKGQPVGPW